MRAMRVLAKVVAAGFFGLAGAYYIYSHFVLGGTDCDAFSFFPLLQFGCQNAILTWILVVAIAVPGMVLWGWVSKSK